MRGMARTSEGYQGCPCPGSLRHCVLSLAVVPPRRDTLPTLAVNRAEPKLFHPSHLLPALMNSSECE